MGLPVTVRMEQDAVLMGIRPAVREANDMVKMPPGYPRDFFSAYLAVSALLFPMTKQLFPVLQGDRHLLGDSFLTVRFPFGVKRV